jgi:DNA-directed RNA polymerase I subunit RPA2
MRSKKTAKKLVETCPSFRRGHLPHADDVERLRSLTAPHVESFNYFLEEGLTRGIKDIEPAELDLIDPKKIRDEGEASIDWSEVSTVKFWMEDVKVAKPVKPNSGRSNRLRPRECRERGLMYAGQLSGKFCYQLVQRRNGVLIDSRPVKLHKTFGDLPLMVLSSACHLQGMAPDDLVKLKEEVRLHYENPRRVSFAFSHW